MYEQEFRSLHPNTSFPQLTEEILSSYDADIVFNGAYPAAGRYQIVYRDGVEQQEDGKWYTKHSLADMDAEGIRNADAQQADAVRNERNNRLSKSDFSQLPDSPVDKAAWAEYRQQLRDLPLQQGFPWDIVWPTKPVSA